MSHVFTYGSLMFPEVWTRVVAGTYRAVHGRVEGHQRFEVRDETYPGMVARADCVVEGVLYLDVDAADLARLDAFEGEDYLRATLPVLSDDGPYDAETYIYRLHDRLHDRLWLPEAFAMDRFLATYCKARLDP